MSNDRDRSFDPTRPTLIVKYGGATRQYKAMDRQVLVIGRCPGCDVGLESPDVAPVHCVIARALDGWHVRDCTGKGGTRLNGQSVLDAPLTDEDVLQVGSFSFTLHLPPEERPAPEAEAPAEPAMRRIRRSRAHLAKLALRLRERVAETAAGASEEAEKRLAARQEELDRQAESLRVLQKDMDDRLAELKQKAQQVAEANLSLAERRAQVDAEGAEKQAGTAAVQAALEEGAAEARRAHEIRARELACFGGHLRRQRQRLNEHEESLTSRWEDWLHEQQQASLAQAARDEKAAFQEALLRDQRDEVVRLLNEMRQLRRQPDPAAEALRQENERLRQELAAAQQAEAEQAARAKEHPSEPALPASGGELERFRVELDVGRRVLDEQVRALQGRFAELERSAGEAENHIAQERKRMVQEREELERLRGALWPADGRSPGAETLVDAPSPFLPLSETADADAPLAPSRAPALSQ